MISRQELNPNNYSLDSEQQTNQDTLFIAINKIRDAYAIPMIVTSGVRSMEDQMRINPSAPKSKHLIGAAVDILDRDSNLYNWCLANENLIAEAGLWLEARRGDWQHFQCLPYGSWIEGKTRWFIP